MSEVSIVHSVPVTASTTSSSATAKYATAVVAAHRTLRSRRFLPATPSHGRLRLRVARAPGQAGRLGEYYVRWDPKPHGLKPPPSLSRRTWAPS